MASQIVRYFLVILGLIAFVEIGHCQTYRGTVVRIVDGAGFILRSNGTEREIRPCGIAAPELQKLGDPQATEALRRLVEGREARCIEVRRGAGTPCDGRSMPTSRGRIVAQCFLGTGVADIAELMIRLDYACDWPKYSGGYYNLTPTTCIREDTPRR